jgi:DNA-binding NarL/FixJ family response regulator
MGTSPAAVVIGTEEHWPDGTCDMLRAKGLTPVFLPSAHGVGVAASTMDLRVIIVDARTLSFGDILALRTFRAHAPRVALVVVGGSSAPTQEMKEALDAEATAFVPRSQLRAILPVVLDSLGKS